MVACRIGSLSGRSRGERAPLQEASGFTLVETLVALLITAIVMATLAPAFLSTLKASNNTNQRSTANSLAVEASEQVRSFPYYQVGYYSSDEPTGCATASTLDEVVLAPAAVSSEPLNSLPASSRIGNVNYSIQRCVYWVNSTVPGDTDAYKESLVTISWTGRTGFQSISLTSSIYPGGQKGYSSKNDLIPTASSSSNCTGVAPGIPQNVVVTDDTVAPSNTIDVSWTASNPTADYYVVLYTDYANPGSTEIDQVIPTGEYSVSPETTATSTQITASPSQQYWVQVQAVACGTPSVASATGTATTTAGTSSSATNPGGCLISTPTTTPSSTPSSEVAVASNGTLRDVSNNKIAFTATVTGGDCENVYVAWAPTGCTPNTGSCATTWTQLSLNKGTLSAALGTGSTNWSSPTTLQFVVYFWVSGSYRPYSPTTSANVLTCQYSAGSSCT